MTIKDGVFIVVAAAIFVGGFVAYGKYNAAYPEDDDKRNMLAWCDAKNKDTPGLYGSRWTEDGRSRCYIMFKTQQ